MIAVSLGSQRYGYDVNNMVCRLNAQLVLHYPSPVRYSNNSPGGGLSPCPPPIDP